MLSSESKESSGTKLKSLLLSLPFSSATSLPLNREEIRERQRIGFFLHIKKTLSISLNSSPLEYFGDEEYSRLPIQNSLESNRIQHYNTNGKNRTKIERQNLISSAQKYSNSNVSAVYYSLVRFGIDSYFFFLLIDVFVVVVVVVVYFFLLLPLIFISIFFYLLKLFCFETIIAIDCYCFQLFRLLSYLFEFNRIWCMILILSIPFFSRQNGHRSIYIFDIFRFDLDSIEFFSQSNLSNSHLVLID